MLLSHLHYDHLDLPSLRAFARELPVVVPRGGARLLRGFADIREVEPGDSVGSASSGSTWSRPTTTGDADPGERSGPALGYVLRGSRSVYFAGDTDLFAGMAEFAPLDVALLPVAGWGKKLGPGHLDPHRAAAALALLRPAVAVPIHWGTYRAGGERAIGRPGRGVRACRRRARPRGRRPDPRRSRASSRGLITPTG